MNIQHVHNDPKKCARALDDIRLRKMVLEAAQMLCTVLNLEANKQVTAYKNTHPTNPLVKWAKRRKNWAWLWHWGNELGNEYIYRFGKRHSSHLVIQSLSFNYEDRIINPCPTPKHFHNAARHRGLGVDYTHIKDTRKAYRKYLRARWKLQGSTPRKNGKIVPPVWTKRKPPRWYRG